MTLYAHIKIGSGSAFKKSRGETRPSTLKRVGTRLATFKMILLSMILSPFSHPLFICEHLRSLNRSQAVTILLHKIIYRYAFGRFNKKEFPTVYERICTYINRFWHCIQKRSRWNTTLHIAAVTISWPALEGEAPAIPLFIYVHIRFNIFQALILLF